MPPFASHGAKISLMEYDNFASMESVKAVSGHELSPVMRYHTFRRKWTKNDNSGKKLTPRRYVLVEFTADANIPILKLSTFGREGNIAPEVRVLAPLGRGRQTT